MDDVEFAEYTEEENVVEVIAKYSAYRKVLESKHISCIKEILKIGDSYPDIDSLIKKIDKTPEIKDGKTLYKNFLLEKKRLIAKNNIIKGLQEGNIQDAVKNVIKNSAISKEEMKVYTAVNDYSLYILDGYYDKAISCMKKNNVNKKEFQVYDKVININMRGRIIRLVFNEFCRGCYAKDDNYIPDILDGQYGKYLTKEERNSYICLIEKFHELWKSDKREIQFFSLMKEGKVEDAREVLYVALGDKDLELSRNQFKDLQEIIKTRNTKVESYNNFVTTFLGIRSKAIEEEDFI